MLTLADIARVTGGRISGRSVRAPSPGHSDGDDGMSITLSDRTPCGFVVNLFNGSHAEALAAKDSICELLDMPAFEPEAKIMNGRVEETIRRIKARSPAKPKPKPKPKIIATYDYTDVAGALVYQVERLSPKGFRQRRPDPDGGWIYKRGDTPAMLYRLPDLLQYPDATVFFCEGEADADRLAKLGLVSTTVSGEAENKWTPELAEPLRGRDVFILQDNDAKGVKRATDAAQALHGLAASVRVVLLPGLPPKGDVSDWLEAGHAKAGLEAACLATPVWQVESAAEPAAKPETATEEAAKPIIATPYTWKAPESLPPRQWLYGRRLMRQIASATVAQSGLGKTALEMVEALAMVSGKALLGVMPPRPLRVWIWNLEEPRSEMERQIQATAKLYDLGPNDIGDRLFLDVDPLVVATMTRDRAVIVRPVLDSLVEEIKRRQVDVMIIDPFVSCHETFENDNKQTNMVVMAWKHVAVAADCSVELVHHVRKGDPETTAESSRGGIAFVDACRNVRVLNRMTKEEGERARITNPRFFFRAFSDKANKVPPSDKSDWHKLEGVDLCNAPPGDSDLIGVPRRWEWPDAMAGISAADFDKIAAAIHAGKWRESPQAKAWVGCAVADALGLNADDKADRAKIMAMLKVWLAAGSLVRVEGEDEKRMKRIFITVRDAAP